MTHRGPSPTVMYVAKRDLDQAAGRFLTALRRIEAGLAQQRQRILDTATNAPRLLSGTPHEVADLTGDHGNDLDYYVYELGRLRAVGNSICTVFGQPGALVNAERTFDQAIPRLKEIRDPLTHPNNNDQLDTVAWFSSLVRLTNAPIANTESLVDPRYEQHDAAMTYAATLTEFLREHVQASVAAART